MSETRIIKSLYHRSNYHLQKMHTPMPLHCTFHSSHVMFIRDVVQRMYTCVYVRGYVRECGWQCVHAHVDMRSCLRHVYIYTYMYSYAHERMQVCRYMRTWSCVHVTWSAAHAFVIETPPANHSTNNNRHVYPLVNVRNTSWWSRTKFTGDACLDLGKLYCHSLDLGKLVLLHVTCLHRILIINLSTY